MPAAPSVACGAAGSDALAAGGAGIISSQLPGTSMKPAVATTSPVQRPSAKPLRALALGLLLFLLLGPQLRKQSAGLDEDFIASRRRAGVDPNDLADQIYDELRARVLEHWMTTP